MGFSDTMERMHSVLERVSIDLDKVHRGNKAAAQRVRVGTIQLEKIAKKFRKESVAAEKSGRLKPKKMIKKSLKKRISK